MVQGGNLRGAMRAPPQQFGPGSNQRPPQRAADLSRSTPSSGPRRGSVERADPNAEFSIEQLDRLDKFMLVVAALGMVTNVVQVYAISNHAWLRATALSNGQPFNSYLSLGSAMFGTPTDPNRDNRFFCGEAEDECSLRTLCAKSTPPVMFDNGLPKDTPQQAWCDVLAAGSLATRFLFFGLLIGLGATAFTTLYSAQSIPWVADQFDKIEELGFEDIHQKYIIFLGWGALWVFIFASMMTYALAVPDSLGWGTVELAESFGLLRLCFVLASVQCALVANSVFDGPFDEAVQELWEAFNKTKWLSWKKALYIELTVQLAAYLMLAVREMDWASMLVVFAWIYLYSGERFMMMIYCTFIIISILFDVLELAEMPSFTGMTDGEFFGSVTWLVIFVFKPIIVGTMVAYDMLEYSKDEPSPAAAAEAKTSAQGYAKLEAGQSRGRSPRGQPAAQPKPAAMPSLPPPGGGGMPPPGQRQPPQQMQYGDPYYDSEEGLNDDERIAA